jgi:AAA15 family ATPase/GTPase
VTFVLNIERNITVISGASATGKTTLVNSIAFYEELGDQSGVTIESPKECHVIRGKNWEELLSKYKDSFIFIDEGNKYVISEDFAKTIRKTDNYYIFITRENLYQLPYSITSILELKKSTSRFKHTYNKTYPRYDRIEQMDSILRDYDVVLTEDSNSGNDLFSYLASQRGVSCVSAKGKSNVLAKMKSFAGKKMIIVADGAAFGSNMAEVYRYTMLHKDKILLYLPESTEWLILTSDIIKDAEIDKIMLDPGSYIESSEFFSWEQFFTDLLVRKTKNTLAAYSKKKLSVYYLQSGNIKKILKIIQKADSDRKI